MNLGGLQGITLTILVRLEEFLRANPIVFRQAISSVMPYRAITNCHDPIPTMVLTMGATGIEASSGTMTGIISSGDHSTIYGATNLSVSLVTGNGITGVIVGSGSEATVIFLPTVITLTSTSGLITRTMSGGKNPSLRGFLI
jgi:hypothetical protein